jgi:ArsR family transcriptional regulator
MPGGRGDRVGWGVSGLTGEEDWIIFERSNMKPSELFAAFADPTRLRILSLLHEQKEVCVCDLCDVLGERQPKVSRHLALLRDVGLVEVRSDGKWKFYALARPETALQRTLLRCVGSCLGEVDELAEDRRRLIGMRDQLRCRT